ncbi:30S ribosomal protein S7 [Candidatus Nomurabacteria bacterium]|nr:30S ribosomal protein S7 [Candidatus Nomurabacteria bacterium]USN94764.1 MAG: 30S ribosomal protein S7 [Candidatus Nomurabacteria bacterium]
MRRKVTNRNKPRPDAVYASEKLSKLINSVMWDGKKSLAEGIVYRALDIIKEKTGNPNPIEVFDLALKNAGPLTQVRSRRVGGANYQVPVEVRPEARQAFAIRWILEGARSKKGMPMEQKLAEEILQASNNEGFAVKKKEDTHRMAEANKAFAHFAW